MDVFRSQFFPKTYCFLEDPVESWIEAYDFDTHHPELAAPLKSIFVKAKIATIFSEPFSYQEEKIRKNVEELKQNHFTFLASRRTREGDTLPFYSALEHPRLPGWVLKPCGSKVPDSRFILGPANSLNDMAYFHPYDGLYRIPMKERIRKIAELEDIPLLVPKKFYAKIPFCNKENPLENTFVIAEKLDVLSTQDTLKMIKSMSTSQQSLLAYRIGRLIQLSGFLDASLNNIRLTPNGEIAIIDTEPAGFLKERGEFPKPFWAGYGHQGTLEKSGRIGLHLLRDQFLDKSLSTPDGKKVAFKGYESFKEMLDTMIDQDYSLKPSSRKKALAVLSFGVLPVLWAIQSLFIHLVLHFLTDKYMYLKKKHADRAILYQYVPYPEKKAKEAKMKYRLNLYLRLIHYFQKDIPKVQEVKLSCPIPASAIC